MYDSLWQTEQGHLSAPLLKCMKRDGQAQSLQAQQCAPGAQVGLSELTFFRGTARLCH